MTVLQEEKDHQDRRVSEVLLGHMDQKDQEVILGVYSMEQVLDQKDLQVTCNFKGAIYWFLSALSADPLVNIVFSFNIKLVLGPTGPRGKMGIPGRWV